MYVKVEEFIQGKTLVRSEELAEHDLKHVASLITKNYFKQVLEPVKNTPDSDSDEKNISLVHADVHPGNFMVFEKENQKFVGIIDRNNFIELDYKDRTLFINLLRQNPEQIAEKMCAYLRDSAQVDIPESVERDIKEEIKAITSVEKEVSKKIPDIMLAFKKRKIRMPLKLTLVVKNLNGLDQLAKQAGFKGGILEAYTYRPKP